jgi:FKBP-type peptidyl-prolyl cis-trans isomerase SlyD
MIQEVPRAELPEDLTIGQMFSVSTDDSGQPTHLVTVVEFNDDKVKLDANHPLAGQDLSFDVSVTEVRDATAEEVEHGHAHGVGGHQH